jgi:sterol desaturase/sphingolipid hydroxylase (fatty acid hydroxylase superfamily)
MIDVMQQLHSFPLLRDILRHCTWLVLMSVIFLPLEFWFAAHERPASRKATLSDLGYYFISGFVPHWLLIIPLSLAAYATYSIVPWRFHAAVATLPVWLSALLAFVLADLGFYWGHRLMHRVPFLWRFHAVHHEPEHLYFLISARAHPVDNVIIRLCGLIPIYVLGVGAPQSVRGTLMATLVMLLMTVWGFFIHANLRWRYGPFEWLVATPAFHHWHHNRSELRDRNFASMLPVWDWLFGTLHLPAHWTPSYGVDEALPQSIIGQLLYPLGAAPGPTGAAEAAARQPDGAAPAAALPASSSSSG